VVPTFTQTPIHWSNLNAIPSPEVALPGTCLEDSTGKRWPALKGIAQKLLAQGRGLRLLVRSLNYYHCGPGDPPISSAFTIQRRVEVTGVVDERQPLVSFAQHVERLVRIVGSKPHTKTVQAVSRDASCENGSSLSTRAIQVDYANERSRPRRRRYWKLLNDPVLEALAMRVYTEVNAKTVEVDRKLSLVTARQLVDRHGHALVESALRELQRRLGVRNASGWLITQLRTS
jgi:hypothetical protein